MGEECCTGLNPPLNGLLNALKTKIKFLVNRKIR